VVSIGPACHRRIRQGSALRRLRQPQFPITLAMAPKSKARSCHYSVSADLRSIEIHWLEDQYLALQ
jgi:hypothetical protein